MKIHVLNEADAEDYQGLRLRALQTNPESFGSTYEREAVFTTEMVQEAFDRMKISLCLVRIIRMVY
ncbi:hypothetical protein [Lysinibacillus telephonicus]|uniref:hypothetical protein n=1 Tax=Lysinibacillus telephonicus TaxID=1714840 RepID=UPI001FE4EC7C|nr:hypothetical protein [Lysinibacillus telephonicus]